MKKSLALLALLGALAPGVPNGFAKPMTWTFSEQIDQLIAEGFERPVAAVTKLEKIHRDADSVDRQRILLQAVGSVHAQTGDAALAEAAADRLAGLAPRDPSGRMLAAASLVRAQLAVSRDRLEAAAGFAEVALKTFQSGCSSNGPTTVQATCDYRSLWAANMVLERTARAAGLPAMAAAYAKAALALAKAAGDTRRQAINLCSLAIHAQERNAPDTANLLAAEARQLVETLADPLELARLGLAESQLNVLQGDLPAGLRALERAMAFLERTSAPRLEAMLLTSRVEIDLQMGRTADVSSAAEQALAVARRFNDIAAQRQLSGDISLLEVMTRPSAETQAVMEDILDAWHRDAQSGTLLRMLRLFSEALAEAGQAQIAIALYHRERALSEQLMRTERSVALRELQVRNETEAQERKISLLAQEKALAVDALADRDFRQRVWQFLAVLMTLILMSVVMLHNRVRRQSRRLAAHQTQLRTQSDCDPLTGLMNRRHFHAAMAARDFSGGFEGTLMMIDVDHFKRVNDVYGHAAGDRVLVDVASRLKETVPDETLVVRWGGEEFVLFAPQLSDGHAGLLASSILSALGTSPINVGTADLQVTASIGYARFPIPNGDIGVSWEQAVRLVDAAMYAAKQEGRNRAIGIAGSAAGVDFGSIERDFSQASSSGDIALARTQGPAERG